MKHDYWSPQVCLQDERDKERGFDYSTPAFPQIKERTEMDKMTASRVGHMLHDKNSAGFMAMYTLCKTYDEFFIHCCMCLGISEEEGRKIENE
jgi:hypothetical protein